MSKLYFFTATFPYGQAETFIETEIIYLSKSFNKITLIPLFGNTAVRRAVPANCEVLDPVIRNKWQHYFIGLFSIISLQLFMKEFFTKKVYKNAARLKTFFIGYCTTNNLLQSKSLRKIVNEAKPEDVFYFYWGIGASYLLPYISDISVKKVVRFHGEWDLYEELSGGGYSPLRESIIQNIDRAVFISKKGCSYFNNKYPAMNTKSIVSYLGTNDLGVCEKSADGIFRLLSCSGVIPLKRLSLIYKSLQLIQNIEIEWTHIGDGVELETLKKDIESSIKNIKVKLLGSYTHQEVMAYYKNNKIDAFINVSSIEGLPVSIMEAISFNVPVIGTDVGGSSEIVMQESGILLLANPTPKEVAEAITKIRQQEFQPKLFWSKMFDANVNYLLFIENTLKCK